jgi:hypothetical protein
MFIAYNEDIPAIFRVETYDRIGTSILLIGFLYMHISHVCRNGTNQWVNSRFVLTASSYCK